MLIQIIFTLFDLIASLLLLHSLVKIFSQKAKFLSSLEALLLYDFAVFLFLFIYPLPSKYIKFSLSLIIPIGFFLVSFIIFFLISKWFRLFLLWKQALVAFFIVMIITNIISYGLTQAIKSMSLAKEETLSTIPFSYVLTPPTNIRVIDAFSESVSWSYLSDYLFKSLACRAVSSLNNNHQPPLSSSPQTISTPNAATTDWRVYIDKEYGFEIKYPPGWMAAKEGMEPKVGLEYYVIFANRKEMKIQKKNQAGETKCLVGIYLYENKESLSLDDWAIKKWGEPDKREIAKITPVKINKLEGLQYEFMSMGIQRNVLISQNNKVIDFHTTFDDCDHLNIIFNRMLSTFKFIK